LWAVLSTQAGSTWKKPYELVKEVNQSHRL
jgi:hypothetical protein